MIELYARGEHRIEVVEESRRWQEAGLISAEQGSAVRERYRPDLVRVNLFIRILLALFTLVGVAALVALPAVVLDVEELGVALLCLLFAPLCAWGADRQLIRHRRLYRCGAEEMLLVLAVVLLALAVALPAHEWGRSAERLGWLTAHAIVLAGAGLLAVRYGYALAALGGVVVLSTLPFHLADALHWHAPGLSRIVLFLALGAVGIWCHLRLTRRTALPRGYVWCLETTRFAVLVGIYLDVNLYTHRLLWCDWLGWTRGAHGTNWSDPLCALLTALLPAAGLILGIGRRDRGLLWFGVLSAVASILTLKYFIHLGYLAEEVTAAGLLLVGTACALLRWLDRGSQRRRGAFTAEPLLEPHLYGLDAEALVAIQPLVPPTHPAEAPGFRPGGGRSGGGGASGGY